MKNISVFVPIKRTIQLENIFILSQWVFRIYVKTIFLACTKVIWHGDMNIFLMLTILRGYLEAKK